MTRFFLTLAVLGVLAVCMTRGWVDGGTATILAVVWLFVMLGVRRVFRLLAGMLLLVRALGG